MTSTASPSLSPVPVPVPVPVSGPDRQARRGRLRTEIALAARIVAPLWPVERFIAVNPLQGLTALPFDQARAEARRWLGAATLPGAAVARRALADGRIEPAELAAALAVAAPDLAEAPTVGGLTALDLVLAELAGGLGPEVDPPGPRTVLERVDAARGTGLAAALDAEVARWCGLLVPGSVGQGSVWTRWAALARHDRRLRRLLGPSVRGRLGALPDRADDAVDDALDALDVPDHRRVDELRGQVARLPGWAGYARWCDEWAADTDPAPRLSLVKLLAVRLTVDALAVDALGGPPGVGGPDPDPKAAPGPRWPSAGRVGRALLAAGLDPEDAGVRSAAAEALARCDDEVVGRAVLTALEAAEERRLLGLLAAGPAAAPTAPTAPGAPAPVPAEPAAQVVCCIDVRSEGLRRAIEAAGPYDTLGFAGFFATPMHYRPLGSATTVPLAPALVRPEVEVREVPDGRVARRSVVRGRQRRARAAATVDDAGHAPLAMFALAEAAGWVLGPRALLATLAPAARARTGPGAPVAGRVEVDAGPSGGAAGFSLDERTLVAELALRTMGLTDGFAPLVVLCGHGATTTANAHASALDCGACGGNRGGANARAAAAVLNDPAVRSELAGRGIPIPGGTWFVAAEHDTTTDEVHLLEAELAPEAHRPGLERLARDLARAGEANAAARLPGLPGRSARRRSDPARAVRARSADWAQTRPEWGLVGNSSFLVGPRSLTRGVDLGGRTFLHSYDAAADPDGTVLETILTAPMVVASWINLSYYGATVEPERWGAGDKLLHNPVPGIGVLEGLGGDLRPGLPWQSVADEHGPRHVPVRLLTLVAAPIDRVEAVIARNRTLGELFDGAWVHLAVLEPGADPASGWQRRQPGGAWAPARPLPTTPEGAP